jgi:hypothetical protein
MTKIPFYKDVDIQDNGKYFTKVEDNFHKTIARLQGKQSNLPEKVIKDVEDYLNKYNKVQTHEIRERKNNERGKKDGTSKEKLLIALKETGNESKYKDFNLIAYTIWGWELMDLSQVEDLIIQDYEKCQKYYDELRKNRNVSLNNDIRLFLHLKARGIDPDPEDFRLIETPEILENQFQLFNQMRFLAGLHTIEYPF